jgi:hypothetical protein
VHERRALLNAGRQPARPRHAQVFHVRLLDLIERAEAPAVERPAPHQPFVRIGILQHCVGDGRNCRHTRGIGRRRRLLCVDSERSNGTQRSGKYQLLHGFSLRARVSSHKALIAAKDDATVVVPAWSSQSLTRGEPAVDTKSSEMQHLNDLADRVTSLEVQIVQLGDEMRAEFSATRAELRKEMRDGDDETRRTLREEIRAGDEETRTLMRVLHEDLVARIALIQRG